MIAVSKRIKSLIQVSMQLAVKVIGLPTLFLGPYSTFDSGIHVLERIADDHFAKFEI